MRYIMLISQDSIPVIIGPYEREFSRSVKVVELQKRDTQKFWYLDTTCEGGAHIFQPDPRYPIVIRKTRFQMDDGKAFPGYTDGNTWNGWEMPYFETKIAEQVVKAYDPHNEDHPADFVAASPKIDMTDPGTGKIKQVISIGGGGWCWDEA